MSDDMRCGIAANPNSGKSTAPCGLPRTPCSMPELDMSDEQIMDWAKAKYGDKLPERLAELRAIIDRAIAKSRKARKE